ncbi:MAG TPA: NHL repeat-containing protein [Thermoanaerobaculia bacterium]
MRLRIAVILLVLAALPLFAQPLVIRTLAGSRSGGGFSDAFGTGARFSVPRAIAADAAGNLWVADTGNHVIRKVTPAGDVVTIAGEPGVAGFADGQGSAARFRFPAGIAVDPVSGTIWISDKDNHVIRRMTPSGAVTTIAGQPGVAGSADAQGSAARFAYPRGLAVDASGGVYVADTQNQVIRRVTADGVAITYAGRMLVDGSSDGLLTDARFRLPSDVAIDAGGILYVSDTGNQSIRKIANGMVTTIAASLETPWGLDVDAAGNVYVADADAGRVLRITPSGSVSTLVNAGLQSPSGVALANGTLFITDALNHAVRGIDPATGAVTTIAGSLPATGHLPYAVTSDGDGNVYVAQGSSIRKITPAGVTTTLVSGLNLATGIDIGPDGYLYVADAAAARVLRVSMSGVVTTFAGSGDEFGAPWSVAVDNLRNVYVTDLSRHRIHVVTSAGNVSTLAGTGTPGLLDGAAAAARFRSPSGIALDAARNLYITDFGNNAVRKYTRATGVVSTLVAPAAGLIAPSGIAADAGGTLLYVADYNHAIYRVTPAGALTVVAGLPGTPGNVDGTGTHARFAYPEGLALTPAGELLIADSYNRAIRVGRVFVGPDRRRVVRR